MNSIFQRLLSNEDGTTMTEFVMTLPIFILCFVGVIQLGQFSEISVRTWAEAHRNTLEAAIVPTEVRASSHAQPWNGRTLGLSTLGLGAPKSATATQKGVYTASETDTYKAMGSHGHWGESYERVQPVSQKVDFRHDDDMTMNSSDIMGESPLARDLVDERAGNYTGSGGGALGVLNSYVSGSGQRPALVAGMRYGAVSGSWTDAHSVAGRTINTRATFNTLVPPYPLTGSDAEFLPTAVVRLTMENHSPYSELLGIGWGQPYQSADFRTSDAPSLGFPK